MYCFVFCCGCQYPWFLPNEVLWKKQTSVSLGPLTEACRLLTDYLLTIPTLKVLPYYQMVVALGHSVESRVTKEIWYVLPYKVTVIPEHIALQSYSDSRTQKTLKISYLHHCHHCPELLSHCYPYSQPLCSNYVHQDQEAGNCCSLPNDYHVTDTRMNSGVHVHATAQYEKQRTKKSTRSHLYLFFTPSLTSNTGMIVFLLRCCIASQIIFP